ncbi:MAG: 50S ribosomal protein L13 [Gammaproteobacteria bacterium]
MGTFQANAANVEQKWYLVDANEKTLGRLATQIASRLRGKHKPTYTPHVDTGDFIVVVNASKIRVTGNKSQDKIYYRHTGYQSGVRATPFKDMIVKNPASVLELAVKGMLPKGPLGRKMFSKLKVYAQEQHPHQAQTPELLAL